MKKRNKPKEFKWYKDGVLLPGRTGSVYGFSKSDIGHTITSEDPETGKVSGVEVKHLDDIKGLVWLEGQFRALRKTNEEQQKKS